MMNGGVGGVGGGRPNYPPLMMERQLRQRSSRPWISTHPTHATAPSQTLNRDHHQFLEVQGCPTTHAQGSGSGFKAEGPGFRVQVQGCVSPTSPAAAFTDTPQGVAGATAAGSPLCQANKIKKNIWYITTVYINQQRRRRRKEEK